MSHILIVIAATAACAASIGSYLWGAPGLAFALLLVDLIVFLAAVAQLWWSMRQLARLSGERAAEMASRRLIDERTHRLSDLLGPTL